MVRVCLCTDDVMCKSDLVAFLKLTVRVHSPAICSSVS